MSDLFVGALVFLATMPWLEYGIHRWVLHGSGRLFQAARHRHAVLHHARGRNDLDVHVGFRWSLALALLYAPIAIWSPWSFVACVVLAEGWRRVWSATHEAIHGDVRWVEGVPGYARVARLHLGHHDNPRSNYAALFLWMDPILGTRGPARGDRP